MKRALAVLALLVLAGLAAAPASADEVLEAARREKARREALGKKSTTASKDSKVVLSNTGLKKTGGKVSEANGSANKSEATPDAAAASDEDKAKAASEEEWKKKLGDAEAAVATSRKDLEALNQRINELRRQSASVDDPNIRLRAADQLRAAEADIPKAQKAIQDAEQGVTNVREEARKSGAPPGWLR